VRHNGMKVAISEGNQSGVWWGVMRSRCSGRYGSGGDAGRWRAPRETAAVGPGKKTTGRGPHISEGGEGKAGWPVGRHVGEGRWATAGPAGRWVDWAESEGNILF
jgi:hypothetical protein